MDQLNESENLEFKLVSLDKLPEDLWEVITAFSNSNGGWIKLGVDDKGNLHGIKPEFFDKIQHDIQSLCSSAFSHKLYPEIKIADNIIIIFIPPAPASMRPIYSIKRGLPNGGRVRIGSANEKLDDEWIRRFSIAAKGGAESITFDKPFKDYFDINLINKYLDIIKNKRGDIFHNLSLIEILTKLRAVSEEKITLFGLLAFSNEYGLQELTSPTTNIAFTQYTGDSKVDPVNIDEVSLDDKEFNGNTVSQFESVLEYLLSRLPVRSRIGSDGKRLDYLAVPETAIREVLANAIAHRDYSTFKGRIQINMYSNRIEFANPGRSLVPIDRLDTTYPETRNPLLMNYLRDLKVTEQRGRGIRTIKVSLKNAGLPEPTFENRHDWFVVTLFTSAFITDNDQTWLQQFKKYKLNERQLKALVFMRNQEPITNSEYRDINNMNQVRDDIKAKKELTRLVRLGLIKTKGEKRYRKYFYEESQS